MKSIWAQNANTFRLLDETNQIPLLNPGVYNLQRDMQGFYLEQTNSEFKFPYKIYGISNKFINRVKKTYLETKGNLGVLLNGIKGTGKTITAELICNALNLPVIIVSNGYEDLNTYFNIIQQDVIIFIDEYEKIFEDSSTILSVMDGVFNTLYRKVFLLTTNSLYINENLLQRPGRLRYVYTFKDLELESIIAIIDDTLKYPEFKNSLIETISKLSFITVDIVKSIVEEVNIHKEEPEDFISFFNIKKAERLFNIKEILDDKTEKVLFESADISPDEPAVDEPFYINGNYYGLVTKIHEDILYINCTDSRKYKQETSNSPKNLKLIKIEKYIPTHKTFNSYVW